MEHDFCKALAANDRKAIKTVIDPFLSRLETGSAEEASFERIREWFEAHECVASVELGAGMLRSEPPLKEFLIRTQGAASESEPMRLRIVVYPDRLVFKSD